LGNLKKEKSPSPNLQQPEKLGEGLIFIVLDRGSFQTFWATFRFEAFKGFSLKVSSFTSFLTWVAKLQDPFAHLIEGSQ
jgi:hypothetical protein